MELLQYKFVSLLHDAAGSQISPLHDVAVSQISLLHYAAGSEISPLHFAMGSQIFPLHFSVKRCDSLLHLALESQILPLQLSLNPIGYHKDRQILLADSQFGAFFCCSIDIMGVPRVAQCHKGTQSNTISLCDVNRAAHVIF